MPALRVQIPQVLEEKFTEIDDALSDFVAEMKLQGVWENVTIFTSSDIARTLTSTD